MRYRSMNESMMTWSTQQQQQQQSSYQFAKTRRRKHHELNLFFGLFTLVTCVVTRHSAECFTISSLSRSSRITSLLTATSPREIAKQKHQPLSKLNNNNNSRRKNNSDNNNNNRRRKNKHRRIKSQSEINRDRLRQSRQDKYEALIKQNNTNIFKFEALFPAPVWDDVAVKRDLHKVIKRDEDITSNKKENAASNRIGVVLTLNYVRRPLVLRNPANCVDLPYKPPIVKSQPIFKEAPRVTDSPSTTATTTTTTTTVTKKTPKEKKPASPKIDRTLTRMVEDRIYGMRRDAAGQSYQYIPLTGNNDMAVQFRDGVRIGDPLKVNCDILTYHGKRELSRGNKEEAKDFYTRAVQMDPRDGRGYIGLSRICQMRRDFVGAREVLKRGITATDRSNAFILQAMGCLEERMGYLSEAEGLFVQAAKVDPSHAAAWVSLAQLRTEKLGRGAYSGRICYQTAEREIKIKSKRPSSYVYTAWAALEYKHANDARKARELFNKALKVDKKCSAAWLQLGKMEADEGFFDEAELCFETVLKFDQRNSRVLQAYAIMESERPDGNSRDVIDLFERALMANSRDAGVLQAYALFVLTLGDIDAARELLLRGTQVNPRHAPVWQAWGVLETRYGNATTARDIFQQGIWNCAQSGGTQSGGRRCARLWQAWGILESQSYDYKAARRCFSRALDADGRNVATVTAWTAMEESIGNEFDARSIFERSLKQFAGGSTAKMSLWRAYELMETRMGNLNAAQGVYQRSMGETMAMVREVDDPVNVDVLNIRSSVPSNTAIPKMDDVLKQEVEVVSWKSRNNFGESEVWMNNGSIEGKVPMARMKKKKMESINP